MGGRWMVRAILVDSDLVDAGGRGEFYDRPAQG